MKTEIHTNEKATAVDSADPQIVHLFYTTKALYKTEGNLETLDRAAGELQICASQFKTLKHIRGQVFVLKGLAINRKKAATIETLVSGKIANLEAANEYIGDAILLAIGHGYSEPSLIKHQSIIKSELADSLHQAGDHFNANVLESNAFKGFSKILAEYPDYAEVYVEAATASFRKVKWSLEKMLFDLSRAESLLDKPKHTRHVPDTKERSAYASRIGELRQHINDLLNKEYTQLSF